MKRGILPLVGSRPKSLSLCYVRDAARAALMAARADVRSGEIFNIADPKACSWEDFGRASGRALGKTLIPLRMPYWAVHAVSAAAEGIGRLSGGAPALNMGKYKQMKPDHWVVDVRKARESLGFETRFSLDAGLRETFAWYISEGRL
jgi:nucleoside-diphosphate-sugar epimerase